MAIDFSKTELPTSKWVTPGYRVCRFTAAKYVESSQKKTPGLEVTVVSVANDEAKFKHVFYLTDKTHSHFKKNYEDIVGKELTAAVNTEKEAIELFAQAINEKKEYGLRVDGRTGNDGNVYATLGISGMIFPSSGFEERDFTDKEAGKYIKASTGTASAPTSDEPVLLS